MVDERMIRKLVDAARRVRGNAYAPYSHFLVGAAVLADDHVDGNDERIFVGINTENAAYGSTICAERTAIGTAITEGHRDLKAIAIVADNEELSLYREQAPFTPPCGSCRQFMAEFNPQMDIILAHVVGDDYEVLNLADLLPRAFTPKDLR